MILYGKKFTTDHIYMKVRYKVQFLKRIFTDGLLAT